MKKKQVINISIEDIWISLPKLDITKSEFEAAEFSIELEFYIYPYSESYILMNFNINVSNTTLINSFPIDLHFHYSDFDSDGSSNFVNMASNFISFEKIQELINDIPCSSINLVLCDEEWDRTNSNIYMRYKDSEMSVCEKNGTLEIDPEKYDLYWSVDYIPSFSPNRAPQISIFPNKSAPLRDIEGHLRDIIPKISFYENSFFMEQGFEHFAVYLDEYTGHFAEVNFDSYLYHEMGYVDKLLEPYLCEPFDQIKLLDSIFRIDTSHLIGIKK